jgi:hypothetical protein
MVYANLQNKITFPKKLDLKWTGIRINFENISIAEAEKVRKLAEEENKKYIFEFIHKFQKDFFIPAFLLVDIEENVSEKDIETDLR